MPRSAKLIAVVTPDMLMANDDSPGPGRVVLYGDCPVCDRNAPDGRRPVGRIGLGRWVIEHAHGCGYTVRALGGLPQTGPSRAVVASRRIVDALAAAR